MKPLYFAVTILDHSLKEQMELLCFHEKIPIIGGAHGHGLAGSEILELLGMDETRKNLFLSVLPKEGQKTLFELLLQRLRINARGRGVAFTIPLSSASGFLDRFARLNNPKGEKSEEEIKVQKDYPYELIIAIVQKGYAEEVKAAAAKAGAQGGTFLHAHGLGGTDSARFLGIQIQPEKDLVLLVAKREHAGPIMSAILEECGIASEGRGICFSLPVLEAIGLAPDLKQL